MEQYLFDPIIQIMSLHSGLGITMGLSDAQIMELIQERKQLPSDFMSKIVPKAKTNRRHYEAEFSMNGEQGHKYVFAIRKHVSNPKSFSVMLRYFDANGKQYILMRCNGNSHDHTNTIEHEKVTGFHIHIATARYLEQGDSKASYAEATNEYSSYGGAIDTLIKRCGFQVGKNKRLEEFIEG